MGEEKAFEPALFGVDKGHIKRYYDAHEYSRKFTIGQMDILQEECAELIQAISKMKRAFASADEEGYDRTKYNAARDHIIEELAHVAISSAVISTELFISQGEIDLEVTRKDNLLKASKLQGIFIDEAHGSDMTGRSKLTGELVSEMFEQEGLE